jgi:hypothetical protein
LESARIIAVGAGQDARSVLCERICHADDPTTSDLLELDCSPAQHRIAELAEDLNMQISGIEGKSSDQIQFEIQQGGKFVLYQYCVSLLVITLKRPSNIYFIAPGQSAVVKGLPWTLLTVLAGWWGIPWGPIYSVQCLIVNLKGGKDVTGQVAAQLKIATPSGLRASAAVGGMTPSGL